MNSQALNTIAKDIEKALASVGEKHGVKIERGRGTYTSSNATLKLKIMDVSESGVVETPERVGWRMAEYYDLNPDWLDKVIVLGGTKYRVAGLNPRSPKNLIAIERVKDGASFKCEKETLVRYFNPFAK